MQQYLRFYKFISIFTTLAFIVFLNIFPFSKVLYAFYLMVLIQLIIILCLGRAINFETSNLFYSTSFNLVIYCISLIYFGIEETLNTFQSLLILALIFWQIFILAYLRVQHDEELIMNPPGMTPLLGLTIEQIDQIPLRIKSPYQGEDNYIICTVCYQELSEAQQFRTLRCLHIYHKECIDPWLKTRSKCPNCSCQLK